MISPLTLVLPPSVHGPKSKQSTQNPTLVAQPKKASAPAVRVWNYDAAKMIVLQQFLLFRQNHVSCRFWLSPRGQVFTFIRPQSQISLVGDCVSQFPVKLKSLNASGYNKVGFVRNLGLLYRGLLM